MRQQWTKTEFTDEEKERVESQTGVTVTEDGTVQVGYRRDPGGRREYDDQP